MGLAAARERPQEVLKANPRLLVEGLGGKNLRFACYKTHGEIKPEECKHVVRANRVNLVLRKAKDKEHWFDLFKKRAIGDDDDP